MCFGIGQLPKMSRGSKQIFQKNQCTGGDFMAVLEYLRRQCSVDELELAGTIACGIWKRRNSVLHGGTFMHPKCIVQDAEEWLT